MIKSLAYIGFVSPRAEEWRSFGADVLGAEVVPDGADGADDVVRLRVDDAVWRIAVHPGEADDLAYLGWEVSDLDGVVAALEAAGVSVDRREAGEVPAGRGDVPVGRGDVVSFTDPSGFRHELVEQVERGGAFTPARPMSGFVTGDQGLGHAVLIVPDLDAALAFYTEVLGFRVSDSVEAGISLRFLHCAGRASRHHSLALVSVPGMVGIHHLMLEVASLDDVGRALDVVNERGLTLPMSLGRHSNDLMTSFYVRTPSGFEIEYGTGGRLVDDEGWEIGAYDSISLWGHQPPAGGTPPPGILRVFEPASSSAGS